MFIILRNFEIIRKSLQTVTDAVTLLVNFELTFRCKITYITSMASVYLSCNVLSIFIENIYI